MGKTSIYSQVQSNLLRRGEQLFPFSSFKEPRDWPGILEELFKLEWDGQEARDETVR